MLDEITSSELAEWQRYYAIEPWPWDLLHFATAKQTQILASAQGSKIDFRDCLVAADRESMPSESEMKLYFERHNAAIKGSLE